MRTNKMDEIYRCGWCGRPVKEDGNALQGIIDEYDANQYLLKNLDSKEINVNGYCCPYGDGTYNI